MKRLSRFVAFFACVCLLLGGTGAFALLDAPEVDLLRQQTALKSQIEDKLQTNILDPILGKDRAKAFADIELEYVSERQDKTKTGSGVAERYKEKDGPKNGTPIPDDFILPGIPRPKNISSTANVPPPKPAAAQGQMASQEQEQKEQVFALRTNVKSLLITVIHDDSIPKAKLDTARDRIVDALAEYKATPDQIVFRPAKFDIVAHKWTDDIKNPNVYLPLLYAFLLLLFLTFLFGPLRRFMMRYIEALLAPKKQEIKQESKNEDVSENEGEGENEPEGPEESKLDIMLGRKPPEPPPPPPDEEDEMKKFEPFSYINEENLKRLVSWFLLRREEPWLIAVVLSYLKPEYARQVLTYLPVELQSKVALEALMVRQVTREQVVAIDNEVKENIDFVVGGIKRLIQILEESDEATRQNIMEYLKNQKPVIYEKVRRQVITFDDVATFPDREMQMIVRELKTDTMAKALQNATPEVVNKFFNNMSPGATSLLKEAMEYATGLTPIQIEEERSHIVDQIKTLEKEGKISVRQASEDGGYQEELAVDREERYGKGKGAKSAASEPAPAALPSPAATAMPQDPAMAQQYLQAGVQSMQSGASDQAVEYLRQAAQLDSNLWQAHQYLGGLLYQLGRVPEAMASYEKVLEFNPDPQLKAWVESYKAQTQ